MSTPFTIEGSLTAPEGSNPADPIAFALAGVFDSRVQYDLNLPSTPASITVDFGTIPVVGAKVVYIAYELRAGAAPVQLTFNGGDEPIELATGGFIVYASPVPAAGITSLAVAFTTVGKLTVLILG